mmetsp:Transcript_51698/g.110532  ORF Transcript_51698/g.110532 Transcript_51698/m.110532 type:complete len:200 (+) Transcript_51698:334-933(+)
MSSMGLCLKRNGVASSSPCRVTASAAPSLLGLTPARSDTTSWNIILRGSGTRVSSVVWIVWCRRSSPRVPQTGVYRSTASTRTPSCLATPVSRTAMQPTLTTSQHSSTRTPTGARNLVERRSSTRRTGRSPMLCSHVPAVFACSTAASITRVVHLRVSFGALAIPPPSSSRCLRLRREPARAQPSSRTQSTKALAWSRW